MMRTDKHQLKPLNSLQETMFLEVMCAYQHEKNYFSDCLSSYSFNHNINLKNNRSYREIRDQLVKDQYCSQYHLPARLWKMALKEAYELHVRTYEAQLSFLKDELIKKIYGYFYKNNNNEINQFKPFFEFAIHSTFYNYFTFKKVEQQIFYKNFYQARIYERIACYLVTLLSKASEKKILTQTQTKILAQLFLKENKNSFFHTFCHLLIGTIQDFRSYKPIVSQINPTIQLDGDCYKLYSYYDENEHKNHWYLDIMSLQKGQRIKRMELTGFHHAKKILKQSANLTLSFNPLTMNVSAHFSFEHKKENKNKKEMVNISKSLKISKTSQDSKDLESLIGGDFGLTESITFSDGFVLGRKQGQILKHIADQTKQSIAKIQKFSLLEFFGMERKNQENRRNHRNHCFNHNIRLKNINTNYRKRQQRYNKRLDNFKYTITNEMVNHFTSNNIYGNYQEHLSKNQNKNYTDSYIHLVFEDLTYSNLGRNTSQKRQINLIKGMYACLENKIKTSDLSFKISYVNPSYTSQTCPNCYYVAKENRSKGMFRCCFCGYTIDNDVRFQRLREGLPKEALPPEDDFIASQNIRDRLSVLPNSLKQQKGEIKDCLMKKHMKKQKKY